jgi:serine phosphatase RsbU (regulator of sigma subunit)
MNKPADQTGGDYYDWQVLPDGRLLVTIADVTGHGIGPALVMAVCRAYSRASASAGGGPAALLNRLNTMLHGDLEGGRFITLATATLGIDGKVEFISAGHGPSLMMRTKAGEVRHFDGDGLPLAIFPDQDYGTPHELQMEAGDMLIMVTDGVIEWHDVDGEQFGSLRLTELVQQSKDQSAESIVKKIFEGVVQHSRGSKQLDDVTIVVIKRLD